MTDRRNSPTDPVRGVDWPESVSTPIVTPLQPGVVYCAPDIDTLNAQYEGGAQGYTYSREGHPNGTVLAQKLDRMEHATGGMMTGSGMGAVTATLLGLLNSGDHVIGGDQLYGRSLRLMTQDLPRFGIQTSLADPTDPAALRAALRPETKAILVEVVSNPTLRVADMQAIAEIARKAGVLLLVDNTFTTPRGFRPLEQGADVVIHSVTKLLAGHSDAMLGYVAARDPAHAQAIWDVIVTMGFTASPYDCWMAERGLYSFDLRFERASRTAADLADFLAEQPGVARVLYPGRTDHPDHARACALLGDAFGNMVSFELKGDAATAQRLTQAVRIPFAPTLGDIGSTLSHPASSSHRGLSPQARQDLGMSDTFFRLSVGIEDADRLKADLAAALQCALE